MVLYGFTSEEIFKKSKYMRTTVIEIYIQPYVAQVYRARATIYILYIYYIYIIYIIIR
jgi:hypothetical protein